MVEFFPWSPEAKSVCCFAVAEFDVKARFASVALVIRVIVPVWPVLLLEMFNSSTNLGCEKFGRIGLEESSKNSLNLIN